MSTAAAWHEWWFSYPRRVGKRDAFKKWEEAISLIAEEKGLSEAGAIAWLQQTTAIFAGSEKGRSGRFCPYPATWLFQGRYDDDQATWGLVSERPRDHRNANLEHERFLLECSKRGIVDEAERERLWAAVEG